MMDAETVTDQDLCDACDEPNRLPKVTWRGMRLCRGHWRQALAGKHDVFLQIAMTRAKRQVESATLLVPDIVRDTIWGEDSDE